MPTILCGDLNDRPDEATTVLLEGPRSETSTAPTRATQSGCTTSDDDCRQPAPSPAYTKPRGTSSTSSWPLHDLQLRLVSIDSLVDDITSIGVSTRSRDVAIVSDHAPV